MNETLNANIDKNNIEDEVIFNRDNVLLTEIHDIAVKERAVLNNEKEITITGRKIFRIVKPPKDPSGEFEVIAQYENESDHTDLTKLKEIFDSQNELYLVTVYIDSYNNSILKWYYSKLIAISDDAEIYHADAIHTCTEEQCKSLDDIFPEYYETSVTNYKLANNKKNK